MWRVWRRSGFPFWIWCKSLPRPLDDPSPPFRDLQRVSKRLRRQRQRRRRFFLFLKTSRLPLLAQSAQVLEKGLLDLVCCQRSVAPGCCQRYPLHVRQCVKVFSCGNAWRRVSAYNYRVRGEIQKEDVAKVVLLGPARRRPFERSFCT